MAKLGELKIEIQTETIYNWLKYVRKYQLISYEPKIFKKYEDFTSLKYDNLNKIESQSIDIKSSLFNRKVGINEFINIGNSSLSLGLSNVIGNQGKVSIMAFSPLITGMGLNINETRKSRANEYFKLS